MFNELEMGYPGLSGTWIGVSPVFAPQAGECSDYIGGDGRLGRDLDIKSGGVGCSLKTSCPPRGIGGEGEDGFELSQSS